jgi:O-antigen ligase
MRGHQRMQERINELACSRKPFYSSSGALAAAHPFILWYRALGLYGQLGMLLALLAVYGLSHQPALLAAEVLGLVALFALNPEAGLLLVVFSIPFAAAYKHVYGVLFSPLEVTTCALAMAWLLSALAYGRRASAAAPGGTPGPHWAFDWPALSYSRLTALDWAVAFFVLVACLSVFAAQDISGALGALRILVAEPVFVYVFIRARGLSERTLPALADALIMGAVAVAVLGLYQYVFTNYVEATEGVRRILSVYDSPNHLGLFLGRVVPVALCVAAFGGPWSRSRLSGSSAARRLLYAVALVPILLCLYLTYSRAAWLLGLPAALLFIGLLRGPRARLLVLAVLALAAVAVIPLVRTPRFASLFDFHDSTSFLRVVLWLGALNMIRAHSLWGVGIGNFVGQYPHYMLPQAWREPVLYHPHDVLLEFWTVFGLPGVVALVGLVGTFFRAGLAHYRRLADKPMLAALMLGLLASMVDCLAHGLVDAAYVLMDLAFVFMLSLAMVGTPPDTR